MLGYGEKLIVDEVIFAYLAIPERLPFCAPLSQATRPSVALDIRDESSSASR